MSTVVLGNWADSPLRLGSRTQSFSVVNGEEELDAGFSFSPLARLEATVVVPLAAEQLDATSSFLIIRRSEPHQGISDVRFQAKTSILERDSIAVAAIIGASIPTGASSALRGHGGPILAPGVAAEFAGVPNVRLLANAAIAFRDDRYAAGVRVGDALRYGAGLELRTGWRDLRFLGSLTGEAGLPTGGIGRNPAEALVGVRFRRSHSPMSFVLAGGPGLGTGYGSPRYRIVAGIYFGARAPGELPSSPNVTPPLSIATSSNTEAPGVESTLVETTANQVAVAMTPSAAPASGSRPRLELDQSIPFEFESATLDEDAVSILRSVAEILRVHSEIVRVEIRGFSDDQGDSDYNASLSIARANAVKAFLEESGIDASRLEAVGLSSDSPRDGAHSRPAHARNRRVEFRILDDG